MPECTSYILMHECIITCKRVCGKEGGGGGAKGASARTAAGTQNIYK